MENRIRLNSFRLSLVIIFDCRPFGMSNFIISILIYTGIGIKKLHFTKGGAGKQKNRLFYGSFAFMRVKALLWRDFKVFAEVFVISAISSKDNSSSYLKEIISL